MRYASKAWRKIIPQWVQAPKYQAWLFALLVCCTLFGLTGWHVLRTYEIVISDSRVTTANLARSMADQAHAVVQEADIVLAGLVERLQAEGAAGVDLARLHRHLVARVAALPRLHHLVVFSATGDALATSFDPMPPINVADRTYFSFHRDHPIAAPLVGSPVQNRADKKWSLTVSRRFDKPDGTFGGVVVAVLDCDTFTQFYASFNIGARGSISLLHENNMPVTRYPLPLDPNFRNVFAAQDWWHQGSAGYGRLISPLDGVARAYSYHRAVDTPLIVVVALAEDDILEVWRHDAWMALAVCSAISALLSLLGWRLARQVQLHEKREIVARRSEEQYRLLADHSTDLIVHLGPDCHRRYVSPSSKHLLGYQPEELLHGHPREITHPEDWPVFEKNFAEVLRSGHAPPITYRVKHKNGLYIWVETQGQSLGSDKGFVLNIRDVTLRKEAEKLLHESNNELRSLNEQLERLARHLTKARDKAELANQAKSRFLAGMSHELRTPLNGILGYAHLLRLESGLNPVQAARVDAMLEAGTHLLQMINRVLDLSEVETGHTETRMSETNPYEVASACLSLVRPSAEAKGLALDLVEASDVCQRITTDPTWLQQILLNLLGNAVKFTARGAVRMRLRTTLDGASLRFEVTDTGPGISTEHRHRLFQEFDRLDAELDGAVEGAGLGLALSARFASMMGGRLGYENNPHGGSVFWLELPLNASEPRAVPASTPLTVVLSPEITQARPLRVLVVDDIAMNRDIAEAFLRTAGHVVVCAEDGTTAVAAAKAAEFDVVLMDVRMPGMDGLEATRRIRALPGSCARVPIVALTAQAFTEQIELCLLAGMDSHLAKPFTPQALLDAVTHAVEKGIVGREASVILSQPTSGNGNVIRARTLPGISVSANPVVTLLDTRAHISGRSLSTSSTSVDLELPVLDMVEFDRMVAFLTPEAVGSYLDTIAERGTALLAELHESEDLVHAKGTLAEAAHTLSGSAGMFGFKRLAAVARSFEHAVQTAAPEAPTVAFHLSITIDATLEKLQSRIPGEVMHE